MVSHVARNADVLQNLLSWAQTGVETPMYATPEQRNADIEAGVGRPAETRADANRTSQALLTAADALPADAWTAEVRTARGRAVPATEVLWMRCREVWIHGIDLGAGATFADVPAPVLDALLDDVTKGFAARDDVPPVLLRVDESGAATRVGSGDDATDVAGPRAALVGWLLGRTDGRELTTSTGRPLPDLPAWL